MIVEIQPVTMGNFGDLPTFRLFPFSCKYCAFWESLDFDEKTSKEGAEQTKRTWFAKMEKEFGNCGFIIYVNNNSVGLAEYAPVKYFPTISRYEGLTPSGDAIFLPCLYIADRELRGKGIGKQALEKVAADLKNRGYNVIEAFAQLSGSPSDNIPDWYTGPLGFFLKTGFKLVNSRRQIGLVRKKI
jgi:GNAT superfamily N-acetyltransferase